MYITVTVKVNSQCELESFVDDVSDVARKRGGKSSHVTSYDQSDPSTNHEIWLYGGDRISEGEK